MAIYNYVKLPWKESCNYPEKLPFTVNLGFILCNNISELNDSLQSVILNEAK